MKTDADLARDLATALEQRRRTELNFDNTSRMVPAPADERLVAAASAFAEADAKVNALVAHFCSGATVSLEEPTGPVEPVEAPAPAAAAHPLPPSA